MKIQRVWNLLGPNIWANFPVIEVLVDLGPDLKDRSSEMIPGFSERLKNWLPGLIEHRCSVGTRGGFFQRLERGTYMAHILEHVTLELLNLAGIEAGFGRARETETDGVYRVAIESEEQSLTHAALHLGHRICLAAVEGDAVDLDAEIQALRELAWEVCLGPSTAAIVQAAKRRQIPALRLKPEESLVQFGYGARARRIRAAETDATSTVAEAIAQDKELTRNLLDVAGVPTPCGEPVASAGEVWAIAQEIGLPVVIKPRFGNMGKGVATNLSGRAEMVAAFERAAQHGGGVLIEQFAPGDDYRLLVVGDRLIAAALRSPAHVIGDGKSSISELVGEVNRDPRRGVGHATALSRIDLGPSALAVLAGQGHETGSVPSRGEKVVIRTNANLSTGGTAIDVTDTVHPDVARRAVDAAIATGLDVAGVDIVARDISKPLEEQGGTVLEVNACPGLRMHLQPSGGLSRPVGEAIVDMLFEQGADGRFSIVAVSGATESSKAVVELLAGILRKAQSGVGVAYSGGMFLDGRQLERGNCAHAEACRALLTHPVATAAILEANPGRVLREGLGFDRAEVGIVTDMASGGALDPEDVGALQLPLVHDADDLARVQRVAIEAVRNDGWSILNGDVPAVADMAEYSSAPVIFFSRDPGSSLLREHLNRDNNRALVLRNNRDIVFHEGNNERVLGRLSRNGRGPVEAVLAAISGAWALDFPDEVIRSGIGMETA